MKTTTPQPLRSKVSIFFIAIGLLGPLLMLIFTGAVALAAAWRQARFEEALTAWIVHLAWLFPLVVLAAVIAEYPFIKIENGEVFCHSLRKRRQFLLSDLVGYAETRKFRQGITLVLSLQDGQRIKIQSSYYRNYSALKQALAEGVDAQPALITAARRAEDGRLLGWTGVVFGAGLLFLLYTRHSLRQLPLEAKGLQTVQAVLAEAPRVEMVEEDGDTRRPVRLALFTQEYPDVKFLLKSSAMQASRVDALTTRLQAGDHIRLLADGKDYYYAVARKDHPIVRLRAVDVYAVRSKGKDLLPLAAYNAGHQAQLEYEQQMAGLAVSVLGLFLFWRGGRYLMGR